ncbi:hypothetical protein [Asticcacaulis sp. EMRT-3]|uniref:hypothetical protein n=1 Tax=Asticcacaulis sp. EMRT-3 TaxID=3040349 RepID=UPI0024AF5113|nr:hypothetical protein [Asticcacaulis sp. EMRT-3]MDI7774273.1 hypothetical protein [Asticcacaulis sp. EMRT-3]
MSEAAKPMFKPASVMSLALLACAAPALATPRLPPATTANGMVTQSAQASQAFLGYKSFLNLSPGERDLIDIYYVLRIKHCDASKVRATLNDNGRAIPLRIEGDGRITPLPTRAQLNSDATITTVRPETCSVAMKLKVTPAQGLRQSYDANGLAQGIQQGNDAMNKIAGILAFTLSKLDRVYFVGGGEAVATTASGPQRLPKTTQNGEYPAGTPYFVPGDVKGATRIQLSHMPSKVLFDTN